MSSEQLIFWRHFFMTTISLKIAVIQSGKRGYEIERQLGLWPSKLSKFVTGIIEPTTEEKTRLAEILNRPIEELFPADPVEAA